MIMSLEELPQNLEAVGIYSSQDDHILTAVKNLSTSPKYIQDPNSYEPCLLEDEETSIDHFFQYTKELKDSWTRSNRE